MAEHEWTDDQTAWLEWYAAPRGSHDPDISTQLLFSAKQGVPVATLQYWRKQKWFKSALSGYLDEFNVSPERIQEVVDAMFEAAKDGDTKAASLYLQYVDRLKPKETKIIIEDKRVEELSERQLLAIVSGESAADALA